MKLIKNNREARRASAAEQIARELAGKLSFIEIHGSRELMLAGCRGIIDYDSEKVRAETVSGEVEITGRALTLEVFRGDVLSVTGKIADVRFISEVQ